MQSVRTASLIKTGTLVFLLAILILSGCKKDDMISLQDMSTEVAQGNEKSSKVYTAVGTVFGTSAVVYGNYRYGTLLTSANYVVIKVNVTTPGTYYLTSNSFNGYNFSATGTFTATGIQYVTLQANGTPMAPSINTFIVNFGNSCVFKVVVVYKNPVYQTSCGESLTYYEVANHKTLRVWLDRNLGASRPGVSYTDYLAYGSLYQWGRGVDGHQCINWIDSETGIPVNGATSTTSSSNTPGHSLFIKNLSNPYDWRIPQNNSLWQGVSGINNPCPSGFRLPTSAELNSERVSWATQNAAGAFASPMKWVLAGGRDIDGGVYDVGTSSGYWSSTVSGVKGTMLCIEESGAFALNEDRAIGYSVRCIKN